MITQRRRIASRLSVMFTTLTAVLTLGITVGSEAAPPPGVTFPNVSVLGTNSVRLQNSAQITAGHVVVNNALSGPSLTPAFELAIGGTATTPAGYAIVADSIQIAGGAVVGGNAFFNTISNSGTINGTQTSPLSLPVFSTLPTFKSYELPVSTTDVTVAKNGTQTITPGKYRDITVKSGGTLNFNQGIFNVRSISVENSGKLFFQNLASGNTEVRVLNQVTTANGSVIGPSGLVSANAAKIVFYVAFPTPAAALTPAAVSIGNGSTVLANLYAPNGTLVLGNGTNAAGAFLAKNVDVGNSVHVDLKTFFNSVPPVADSQGPLATGEDTPLPITLSASDVDSPTLTFTIVSPPAHGGLSVITGTSCTPAGAGATCTANVTYTPAANYNGPDSFTFKANDGFGDSNVATVSITVNAAPDAPVANGQSTSTNEETTKPITLSGTDPDGDTLSFAIGTGPSHGTLSPTITFVSCTIDGSTGASTCTATVDYTPATNFNGNDSFTFTVNDGTTTSAPGTVSITVTNTNDAPVAAGQAVDVNKNTEKTITLSATDVDGNNLTFSIVTTVPATPEHGSLTAVTPISCSVDGSGTSTCTAEVKYTPNTDYTGPDSFKFKVNDGTVDSNEATVSITVAQPAIAPAFTSTNTVTFRPGLAGQTFTVTTTGTPTNTITVNSGTFPLNVTFTDNGNNTATIAGTPNAGTQSLSPYALVFKATNGVPPDATQSFTFRVECPTITVSGPTPLNLTINVAMSTATYTQTGGSGTIVWSATGLPNGVSINSGTGDVTGTPTQSGQFNATITATDAGNCTGTKSVTVNVNQPPAFTSATTVTFRPGLPGQTFSVTTTGFPTNAITLDSGTFPLNVTLTDNNNNTATISGTPAAGTQTSTPYSLVFRAANGVVPDATQNFSFKVECPTITVSGTIPALTYNVAMTAVTFTQSGGSATINWSATGLPTGIGINSGTGQVSGTPTVTGTFNVTVTATDAGACTGSKNQSVTVAPVATNDAYTGLVDNTQLVVTGGSTTSPTTPFVGKTAKLTDNDQPSGGVSATVGTFATSAGGSVTIAADGTFIYTPGAHPGAARTTSDSFTYTVTSNTGGGAAVTSAPATVNLALVGRVWYVLNNGAAGNGQSQSPFNTLSAAIAASTAGASATDTDTIYVYQGNGATTNLDTASILKSLQSFIGQGVALTVNGNTLVAAGGFPLIGNTLTLANTVIVNGIDMSTGANSALVGANTISLSVTVRNLTTTTGTALNLSGATHPTGTVALTKLTTSGGGGGAVHVSLTNSDATVTVSDTTSSLAGAGANTKAIDINGGTGSFTYPGTISNTGSTGTNGGGINVATKTGTSTVTLSGNTITLNTGANPAFNMSGNSTGTTVNVTPAGGGNGLDITTTSGTGFNATGGGTVVVTGSGNTITSTSATALNVANTTIGAGGLTFLSISSGNNTVDADPVNGIVLNTTGASGGLTVQGNGGGSSDGSGGTIQHTTGDGILLTSTMNVSLNYLNVQSNLGSGIHGTGVTNFTLTRSNVTSNGDSTADDGLRLGETGGSVVGVTGTVTISNSNISGNAHNGVHIRNTSGTIASLTVTNSTFNNVNDTTGANAFLFETSGTAVTTAASLTGNTFSNNSPQRALEVQAHETGTIGHTTVPVSYFVVDGNTFTANGIHASFTQDGSANLAFKFLNNSVTTAATVDNVLQAVNIFSSSQATGGTIVGVVSGNTINTDGENISGIAGVIQGRTVGTFLIDGNTITNVSGNRGIDMAFRGPTADLGATQHNITITNNNVSNTNAFPLAAISLEADNQSTAFASAPTVRADIRGNTVPASGCSDLTTGCLQFYEYDGDATPNEGTDGIGQLVNTTGAATATQQLGNTNTGSVAAVGVSLIAGPISTPP